MLPGALVGFEGTLLGRAWSRDYSEPRVAVGGAGGTVTVWKVENGWVLYKLPGYKGILTRVDFHPKGSMVLRGSNDAALFCML